MYEERQHQAQRQKVMEVMWRQDVTVLTGRLSIERPGLCFQSLLKVTKHKVLLEIGRFLWISL